MGMQLSLFSLTDRHAGALLDDPSLLWDVLAENAPDLHPTGRPRLVLAEGEVEEIEIDKAWHGIHYLLTGEAWKGEPPLDFILIGGAEVGDIDTGYGPARAFRADEVRTIAAALAGVTPASLAGRFDADDMEALDIYPAIWDEGREALEYCLLNFDTLKTFVLRTAGRGYGMLLHMR